MTKGLRIDNIPYPGTARGELAHRPVMHTHKVKLPSHARLRQMFKLRKMIKLVTDTASNKPDCLLRF